MHAVVYISVIYIFMLNHVQSLSNWKPSRRLWYFISDDGDEVDYAEAQERCRLLHGRLAVLPDWHETQKKLSIFTGSAKRWITLSNGTLSVINTQDNGISVDIEIKDTDQKYGYICDWQCHSLGVFPQTTRYIVHGIYTLENTNKIRQRYYSSNNVHIVYRRIDSQMPHWDIDNDGDSNWAYAKKPSWDFTPYNNTHEWEMSDTTNDVNFFCHDCKVLHVSSPNLEAKTLYKFENQAKYIDDSGDSFIMYRQSSNEFCLHWEQRITYCVMYMIIPTVNYEVTFTVDYLNSPTDVSISCITLPLLHTTEKSTVTDATNVDQEIASVYDSHITTNHLDTKITDDVPVTKTQTTKSYDDTGEQIGNPTNTISLVLIPCVVSSFLIIGIVITVVCVRRRKNKHTPNKEFNTINNIPKVKDNVYNSNPISNDNTQTDFIHTVRGLGNNRPGTYANPDYDSVHGRTTNQNMYCDVENVELVDEHVYINKDYVPQSDTTQSTVRNIYSQVKPRHMRTTDWQQIDGTRSCDDDAINTQYYNASMYDEEESAAPFEFGENLSERKSCDSDLELYNNSLYEGSDRSIGKGKSELIYSDKENDIEMYDNEVYGS